jgi:hypothetical protein
LEQRRKCLGNRQHYNSGETCGDQLEWTDGLGEPGEYIIRDRLEAAYTLPTSPGIHQYGATSLINGWAYDGTVATVGFAYAEAQVYQ